MEGELFDHIDADQPAAVASVWDMENRQRRGAFSTFTMEAGNELAKVTWPTWSETRLSTIVVIVTTFIISLILGGFDYLWAALSSFVYDV